MFGSSNLLNKRLARSLWGTKLRLSAVIGMIFVGVFAGITFGGYSANLGPMYDSIYEDSDSGSNLADIWIDNESSIWSSDQVQSLCSAQRLRPPGPRELSPWINARAGS